MSQLIFILNISLINIYSALLLTLSKDMSLYEPRHQDPKHTPSYYTDYTAQSQQHSL